MRRRENDMLWNTQHERNRANHIISRCMFLSSLHLIPLQKDATLLDITCCVHLQTLLHIVAFCWELLSKVWKRPNFRPSDSQHFFCQFRDRRSVAQQCWICLHSSFQHCWGHVAQHANYTWSSIYPPHDALQVPKFGSCFICTPLHTQKEATTPCYVRLHITLVAFKSFSGRYSWSLQIRPRKVSREAKKWTWKEFFSC